MMQPVAILLIAVSAGANPWNAPQAAEQSAAVQKRVDSPWGDETTVDDHQYQIDRNARRRTEPLAPTPMSEARNRNPYRGAQLPSRGGAISSPGDVRLAQFVENDAWPTAGTAASAARRGAGRAPSATNGNSQAPQFVTPDYFGTNRAATPADGQPAGADAFRQPANNRVPATLEDPYKTDRLNQTRNYAPNAAQPNPVPAGDREPTVQRRLDEISADAFDAPRYRSTGNGRADTQMPNSVPSNDPYAAYQEENTRPQQPAQRRKPPFTQAQPIQTPRIADNTDVNSHAGVPPRNRTATPNNSTDPTEPDPTTRATPTPPMTIDPNTQNRGGGTLLLLAFFASVGLNFYLGWIAWDTYNRYQDMVSDIRYSKSSARRERVERDRDLVDRRSATDRRLVDSAAY